MLVRGGTGFRPRRGQRPLPTPDWRDRANGMADLGSGASAPRIAACLHDAERLHYRPEPRLHFLSTRRVALPTRPDAILSTNSPQ